MQARQVPITGAISALDLNIQYLQENVAFQQQPAPTKATRRRKREVLTTLDTVVEEDIPETEEEEADLLGGNLLETMPVVLYSATNAGYFASC